MAEVITMPRLSDTMEEGRVAKWLKNVGDSVKEGDILAEIETDKAVQDFETEFSGILLYIGVEEGNAAKVDTILAIVGQKGEDISSLIDNGELKIENNSNAVEETVKVTTQSQISNLTSQISAEIITMPRLSDTMEEGKVAKWLKNVGDTIKEGDLLAEIETDKAVQDFESEFNGTLLYQGVSEGSAAKVDTILAIIGEKGTDISGVIENGQLKSENISIPNEVITESNNQTKNQEQKSNNNRIFISPLAKQLAKDKGIDIAIISGSGENGRIIKKDVENFKGGSIASTSTQKTPPISVPIISGVDSETPNSQVRNIIAKRLSESKNTAPHYYLTIELDMDNAIKSREIINSVPNTKVSFNDLVVKSVAVALRSHLQVNSSWAGDKIVHHGNINIGVAVAIEDGLVVPVLKNTDFMSLSQISATVKDMAGRAKERKLKADEMDGSTFSISNLGMFGIESFTSIINQPNSCILSVGAIIQKPIVKNGEIVVGNVMKVTLAADHRVVDGATGAQFLQTFKKYMENPITLLA